MSYLGLTVQFVGMEYMDDTAKSSKHAPTSVLTWPNRSCSASCHSRICSNSEFLICD